MAGPTVVVIYKFFKGESLNGPEVHAVDTGDMGGTREIKYGRGRYIDY
ncbi:MAG: hypothetical protein HOC20_03835 [Chloroflexi bacterium]|jgi:hypothetical protein|nr:hypothetical protein [Chloroflexota bacterium]